MRPARTLIAAALTAAMAWSLSACADATDHVAQANAAIPDLAERGYQSIDCAQGEVLGAVYEPVDDERFQLQCWTGAADRPFYDEATVITQDILTNTEGTLFTDQVCPQDVLTEATGVACRALIFGSTDGGALLGITVALVDPGTVTQGLGDQPTAAQLEQALAGAEVEILIGTDGIEPGQAD